MEVKLISLEVSGHLTIIITFWKVGDPITMLVTKYGLIMTNCKLSIFVCQSVQQKPALSFVSVLDKYGPLSNCERSIFVHRSVEQSTLSSTTGAAIGWQQDHITSDFTNIQRLFQFHVVYETCLSSSS